MGYFKYEARNTDEKAIVRDTIEAETMKEAMEKLRVAGLVVLHIEQSFTKPGEAPLETRKSLLDRVKDFLGKLKGDLQDL